MKVFISWSGKQSQAVASALYKWIPTVVPSASPWFSPHDIPAGSRWFDELMHQLETARLCIICMTPDNVRSPWIYYEAGAIAGRRQDANICGLLTGISATQISGPISQFQCVESNAEGVWALIRRINQLSPDKLEDERNLKDSFDAKWPKLKEFLKEALLSYSPSKSHSEVEPDQRYKLSDEARELLVEAAADSHGSILMYRTISGLAVQTNQRQLCNRNDPRSEAKWLGAVRELIQERLIEGRGNKGETFNVTAEGYRVADNLKSATSASK